MQTGSAADCPLCANLGQELTDLEDLVWEFPRSVAFLGPWQYYQGYVVLVARGHARELFDLEATARAEFVDEMCGLAKAIARAFRPRKLNYELLGNQVPHLHWHLFPRYESDPERLKPVWVALDRAERDAAERERLLHGTLTRNEIKQRLRTELEQLVP